MAKTPQLHKPAPTITETGDELLNIEIKGIARLQEYENHEHHVLRVLTPLGTDKPKPIYACQGVFVPRNPRGEAGPLQTFWFRIPAGSIEQAYERGDEAMALAGPAFEKRFWEKVREEARRLVIAEKEPSFRRGGTGGDGNGRLRMP